MSDLFGERKEAVTIELVDVVMFVLSGMALGFVIGATVMKKTMTVTNRREKEMEMRRLFYLASKIADDGAAFHEERGDIS